jgi:hypothetical protein
MKPSASMPRLSKSLVRKRRAELKRLHKIYSWRVIARDFYDDQIQFGTLQRFATDRTYTPKDPSLLDLLGVMVTPSPYRQLPKWFKRTPQALEYFNTKRAQIQTLSNEAKRQRKENNQ